MLVLAVVKRGPVAGAPLALLLLASSLVLALNWDTWFRQFLDSQMSLAPGTLAFDSWRAPPVPFYLDIYFHNWTNPDELKWEKPAFKEMGPYRFHEKREKVDLVWHENGTVSYKQLRTWYFDEENSVGKLTDKVTTVNVIALAVAYTSRFGSYFDKKAVSYALIAFRQKVHITKTVGQLLFDGYSDDLITLTNIMPESLKRGAKTQDRFGWFYQRNGSGEAEGVLTARSGPGGGGILAWNGRNRTGFFEGECGAVGGGGGELYPRPLDPHSAISLFAPDLCRKLDLKFKEDGEVRGLKCLVFEGGPEALGGEGSCTCSRGGNAEGGEGDCPSGLLNLTSCRWGVPVFASYPHFLHADRRLVDGVSGLSPDPQKHAFQILLQPSLGIPLEYKGRFQINVMLENMDAYRMYSDIPGRLYMPIFWMDHTAKLTAWQGWQVWGLAWGRWLGPGVAAAMALAAPAFVLRPRLPPTAAP